MAEIVEVPPLVLARPRWLRVAPALEVLGDYLSLVKPGIMLLLVLTELATLLMASRGWPGSRLLVAGVLGGICASGGASAFNCWYDRDLDREMRRTAGRPLPAGRVAAWHALALSIVLTGLSILVLGFLGNWLAALLSACGAVFYCFVYTAWLKRWTRHNIVIGGAAGCFPPLVGWALVTGSLSALPLLLALIVLFWTPPHFWSLALYRAKEYAKVGLPMLPVTHGSAYTRLHILLYTAALIAVSLLPFAIRMSGYVYLASAVALGAVFAAYAIALLRRYSDGLARRTFRYSIVYLAALFSALLIDHYLH